MLLHVVLCYQTRFGHTLFALSMLVDVVFCCMSFSCGVVYWLMLSYALNKLLVTCVLFCVMLFNDAICCIALSCVVLCCLMLSEAIKELLARRFFFLIMLPYVV